MQWNWKSMLPSMVTSLVAFTSLVNADTDSAQMRNLDNRVTALEQRRGASGMINPPGRPQVRDGADLFIFGQALYWKAHENGVPFVVAGHDSDSLSHSKIYTIHPHWDWGFRLGAGYNMPHDGWDLSLTWLRFYTKGHKKVNGDSDDFLYTTRAHPADPFTTADNYCHKSKSYLRINLNQLDLDLGREFFVSKWLTVRPHFGLRSDWIRQKWETKYKNFHNYGRHSKIEAEYKDHWFGIGLEGGLDTDWGLGNGFSLFGNLTTAIVYGLHNMKYEDENNGDTDSDFAGTKEAYRISNAILDLMMGLRWDKMFSDDRFHIGLEIGWEHHVYFNQNQFPVFTDDFTLGTNVGNQGDLTYQGWTAGLRFDF